MSEPQPLPIGPWERVLDRLLPDNKGWMSIAAVGVMFFLLEMIRENPALLANASFMQFTGMLATGSFLVVMSHFYGGTKVGSDVMVANSKSVVETAKSGTGNGAPPAGGQGDPHHDVLDQPAGKSVPVTEAAKGPGGPAAGFMSEPVK